MTRETQKPVGRARWREADRVTTVDLTGHLREDRHHVLSALGREGGFTVLTLVPPPNIWILHFSRQVRRPGFCRTGRMATFGKSAISSMVQQSLLRRARIRGISLALSLLRLILLIFGPQPLIFGHARGLGQGTAVGYEAARRARRSRRDLVSQLNIGGFGDLTVPSTLPSLTVLSAAGTPMLTSVPVCGRITNRDAGPRGVGCERPPVVRAENRKKSDGGVESCLG